MNFSHGFEGLFVCCLPFVAVTNHCCRQSKHIYFYVKQCKSFKLHVFYLSFQWIQLKAKIFLPLNCNQLFRVCVMLSICIFVVVVVFAFGRFILLLSADSRNVELEQSSKNCVNEWHKWCCMADSVNRLHSNKNKHTYTKTLVVIIV